MTIEGFLINTATYGMMMVCIAMIVITFKYRDNGKKDS